MSKVRTNKKIEVNYKISKRISTATSFETNIATPFFYLQMLPKTIKNWRFDGAVENIDVEMQFLLYDPS